MSVDGCLLCVGCSEMLMASAVQDLAAKTPGKESIAIEAFAKALRMVCGESCLWCECVCVCT